MPATDTRLSSPVVDALRQRRSVRAFTDRPVDSALLAEVFAAAQRAPSGGNLQPWQRSEEHTSELQSLMRISYAVFCLKNKTDRTSTHIRLSSTHHIQSYN